MEIGQFTWSRQTVVLSERDWSEEEIFLMQSSSASQLRGKLKPASWNIEVGPAIFKKKKAKSYV